MVAAVEVCLVGLSAPLLQYLLSACFILVVVPKQTTNPRPMPDAMAVSCEQRLFWTSCCQGRDGGRDSLMEVGKPKPSVCTTGLKSPLPMALTWNEEGMTAKAISGVSFLVSREKRDYGKTRSGWIASPERGLQRQQAKQEYDVHHHGE